MCTISFLPAGPEAYLLASNRDELKTRKKESAPEIHWVHGIRCIWPVDGEAGGTWIAVNEFGCSYTLMNDYQSPEPDLKASSENKKVHSRGHIIPQIAGDRSVEDVTKRLDNMLNSPYKPFRLLMADANNGVFMWHFDGKTLKRHHQSFGAGLWVSAGKNESRVLAGRRKVFEAFLKKAYTDPLQRIKDLHTSKIPEPGALAVSMELENVQTVSSTIVEVRIPDHICLHYMQGLPSSQGIWQRYTL
jgi:uncharacterized protein with NRDE domain